MTKLEQFFYDHAGSSHDPLHETEEEGRMRNAAALVTAARYALEHDWIFEWGPDECDCDVDGPDKHATECCILRAVDGEVLASLSGICDATEEYRRVVQAELAQEAMWREGATAGPQEAQEASPAAVPRFTVTLHYMRPYMKPKTREIYEGDDEGVMYSHVNAVEWTLAACHGTAEIEIVEDGQSRWIDYRDGVRPDFPQEDE